MRTADSTVTTSPPGGLARRAPLFGALVGLSVGLFDYVFFRAIGVTMRLGDADATLVVCALFAATYGVLGYLTGRLAAAQAALRASAALVRESQRRALHSEKLAAIGQLAAGVAHEVRNPLGVIRASAAVLVEDLAPGSDAARAGVFIVDEVDRLNAVVRALLDYSRPLAPRRERVALDELLAAVRPLVDDALRRGALTLEAGADEAPLVGDPDLLAQLALTLVDNAAAVAPRGGRVILSTIDRGDQVELRIADDGPGVDPAIAGRIFEPFFSARAGGTGLGLALAARVAEAHGGVLSLRPGEGIGADGRGACFALTLPRAPAEAA
ncbi:MAG: ATP-binding protein [Nannocystaceae bacterium]